MIPLLCLVGIVRREVGDRSEPINGDLLIVVVVQQNLGAALHRGLVSVASFFLVCVQRVRKVGVSVLSRVINPDDKIYLFSVFEEVHESGALYKSLLPQHDLAAWLSRLVVERELGFVLVNDIVHRGLEEAHELIVRTLFVDIPALHAKLLLLNIVAEAPDGNLEGLPLWVEVVLDHFGRVDREPVVADLFEEAQEGVAFAEVAVGVD